MAAVAPAVAKLVQGTVDAPSSRPRRPGSAAQALTSSISAMRCALCSAASVRTLSSQASTTLCASLQASSNCFHRRMVGHAALVGLLPLLAQLAQRFLHLAPAERLAVGALEQGLGLGHQLLAHLVGAPALPAFELTGRHQRGMHLLLRARVSMCLPCSLSTRAQRRGSPGAGLAMAFGRFLLELGQRVVHGLRGLGDHGRVDLGLGRRVPGVRLRPALRRARRGRRAAHRPTPARAAAAPAASSAAAAAWASGGLERLPHHEQLRADASSSGGKRASTLAQLASPASLVGLVLPVRARRRAALRAPPARRARTWSTAPRCAGPAARRPRAAPARGAAGLRCPSRGRPAAP